MPTQVTSQLTDGTSSDAIQSFFNKNLLRIAEYELLYELLTEKYSLGMRSGITMIFRRYVKLALATAELTEAVPPAGKIKTKTDLSTTLAQFGDYIKSSTFLNDTQPDSQVMVDIDLLGKQKGETFDRLARGMWQTGTNDVFANGTATNQVNTIIDQPLIDRLWVDMQNSKASRVSPMISASQNVGTGPVEPSYIMFLSPEAMVDARKLPGFVLPSAYGQGRGIMPGEQGSIPLGIKFLVSPEAPIAADAGGAKGSTASASGTSSDVHSCILVGMNAAGSLGLGMDNGGIIRRDRNSGGTTDPLGQIETTGWIKAWSSLLTNETWMREVKVAVSA